MNRVYQGGHHDIWCDGTTHVQTEGGWVWPDKPFEEKQYVNRRYPCDCETWKQLNEAMKT